MSDEAGYTLAEALTALTIVALAMVGLTQAVRLATLQASTAARLHGRAADLAAVQHLFGVFPQSAGPFDAANQALIGDQRHVAFACGARATCTMDLTATGQNFKLSAAGSGLARTVILDSHFQPALQYVAKDGTVSAHWPQEGQAAGLAAIMLTDHDAVLAIQRFAVNLDLSCGPTASQTCGSNARDIP